MEPFDHLGLWPSGCRGVVICDRGGDELEPATSAHGDLTTPLAWASITKLATALCLHVCAADGVVALDEQVADNGATLSDVLSHAGGFGPEGTIPTNEPGRRRVYSNGGYEIAAAHLERALGLSFETVVRESVLDALSMDRTHLAGSPASGMEGPVSDLLLLLDELMAPTLLDSDEAAVIREVTWPSTAGVLPGFGRFDPCPWGVGPEVKGGKEPHWTGPSWGPTSFGHFGQAGGFVAIDPVRRLGVATLGDVPFGPWSRDAWPRFLEAVWSSSAGGDR